MGDFDQAISRRTSPTPVLAALEVIIGDRLRVATVGPFAPLDRPSIDHIAHTLELACDEVTVLPILGTDGELQSDHFGVMGTVRGKQTS